MLPAPAVVPDGADSRRAWAQALVDRARSEGVALTGEDGLLTSMVREALQAGLDVEMAEHLGYEPYEPAGRNTGNSRNGSYPKDLTDRSGTHWTFVGQVERGQRNLNLHNLLKLANGLKLDPGELVRGLAAPLSHEPDV